MKYFLSFFFTLIAVSIGSCQTGLPLDQHTKVLFNGEHLDFWEIRDVGDAAFRIEDGKLYSDKFKTGDFIFTQEEYGNFIFKFEYMLPTEGNSGVIIRAGSERPYDWETGFEVQLISPWMPRADDFHCTGSIYGHVAVQNRPKETPEEWHSMEVKCDRKFIETIVDGNVTIRVDTDTVPTLNDKLLKGHIGFQPNHAEVEGKYVKFRNVSVRNLDLDPEYVAKGFYEKDERLRVLAQESAVSLGAAMVDHLVLLLLDQNTMVKNGAKQVLFDLVANVSDLTSSEDKRNAVARALKTNIQKASDEYVRTYLQELNRMVN